MHILRKLTVGVTASLFVVLLFSFGIALGIKQVLGSPDGIKQALQESGFYDSAVGAALDQAQKDQQASPDANQGSDTIPIDRPEVKDIIKQAMSPSFLQAQSEQSLDSIYAWLNGSSSTLGFTIDLTDAKTKLADGMGSYVQNRLASLPVCTPSAVPPSGDVDVFNTPCVPAGFDVSKAGADAKNEILTGEFLKDTKITPGTVKNDDGKTLDQQLQHVPESYQRFNEGVLTTGVIVVLLGVAIVFLSATRRRGIRKVAITCITVGTFSVVLAWLSSFAVQRAEQELAKTSSDQPLQQHIMDVVTLLVNDLRHWWMGFGITIIVLGIGTLVALHFIKPKGAKLAEKVAGTSDEAPVESTAEAETTEVAQKAKSRPPRKLVQ